MEINWKDFGLMYPIGIIILIPTFIIVTIAESIFFFMTSGGAGLYFELIAGFIYLLLSILPACAFYFWRNKCDSKTTTIIGIAFGISFWAFILLSLSLVRFFYNFFQPNLLT